MPSAGVDDVAFANLIDSAGRIAQTLHPVTSHAVSAAFLPPSGEAGPAAPSACGPRDFAAFFRTTLAPLRRYVARLIGSADEAQDIAQDAYARVYTVMQEREVKHPQALLYTTARHLAIDELKHRSRAPFEPVLAEGVPSPAPATEAIVMAREEAAMLEQAIRSLPEDCRRVLLLRTGEQLTHEEVAFRLGLTRKQAEKRMHRAVRLLHLALNPPSGTTPPRSDHDPC